MSEAEGLREGLMGAHVIVVGGPGGVGKTTTAAALAVAAANAGRRAVVVTVDPARRLADALGRPDGLPSQPALLTTHDSGGALWAMMLDPKDTFDRLVTDEAANEDQAQRILQNPFYRNMSGGLSGTHEYMASEQLHSLAADDRFDLVVVDTPPSRHALDFIDSPARLVRLLESRLYRLLTAPARGAMRAAGLAAIGFMKVVQRAVGGQVVEDAVRLCPRQAISIA